MATFLYIFLGIFILILILAAVAPKTYDVSRSIEINKPRQAVFEFLKYLKNMEAWSPWEKKDPNMKKSFTGTDGEVGAISHWVGNKDVGEGEQEIKNIVEGQRIDSELRFIKPWKSTSDCYTVIEEAQGSSSKVTWGFSGKNKFPMSIMALFMSMDKMVGKDFEDGLATLKKVMETDHGKLGATDDL